MSTMMTSQLFATVMALGCVMAACGAHVYSKEDMASFLGKTCTNMAEVQEKINFSNINVDPYPTLWYDTTFEEERDCYVIYPSEEDRSMYELKTLTAEEAEAYSHRRFFLTHKRQCGVCSQLTDLVVYAGTPDLTNPVRRCALRMIPSWTISCLKNIGFTEECAMIWFWNTQNTKKLARNGGCFGVCMANIFTPNNQPEGHYNPCEPFEGMVTEGGVNVRELEAGGSSTENELVDDPDTRQVNLLNTQTPDVVSASDLSLPAIWSGGACKDCCTPRTKKKQHGLCGNLINGRPACEAQQWQNNEYRMNPCLQCDECRSGPIFQKIAGRTRRNSGIFSAIDRPGVTEYIHNYA